MKGQQQVISSIMLAGLFMALVVSVYMWGLPIIDKNRGIIYLNRAEAVSKEISNKITSVTLSQGKDSFYFDLPGRIAFIPGVSDSVLSTPHGELFMRMDVRGTVYATNVPIYLTNNMMGLTQRDLGSVDPVLSYIMVTRVGEKYMHVYNMSTTPLNYTGGCTFINLTGSPFIKGQGHDVYLEYQDTINVYGDSSYPSYCQGRVVKVVNVKVSSR